MKFLKMHGAGNDFIVVNNMNKTIELSADAIAKLCDRHKGIGADGLILVEPSDSAPVFMNYYNSDGSIAQMCGNGTRCLAKFVTDQGIVNKREFDVMTRKGRVGIDMIDERPEKSIVRVDMGPVNFKASSLPVLTGKEELMGEDLLWNGKHYQYGCASMGNPHMVIVTDDFNNTPIETIGPLYESHPMFPEKCNISFAQVIDKEHIRMDTWERGDGRTLACGTGTCASVAVLNRLGLVGRHVEATLSGGVLKVDLEADTTYMTGPAEPVFTGEIDLEAS